jgi:hypothetical protein
MGRRRWIIAAILLGLGLPLGILSEGWFSESAPLAPRNSGTMGNTDEHAESSQAEARRKPSVTMGSSGLAGTTTPSVVVTRHGPPSAHGMSDRPMRRVVTPDQAPGLPRSPDHRDRLRRGLPDEPTYQVQHVIGDGPRVIIPSGDPTSGFMLDPQESHGRVEITLWPDAPECILHLPTLGQGMLRINGIEAVPGQDYPVTQGMVLEALRPVAINIRPAKPLTPPGNGSG